MIDKKAALNNLELSRQVSNLCKTGNYEIASFKILNLNKGIDFVNSMVPTLISNVDAQELNSIINAIGE